MNKLFFIFLSVVLLASCSSMNVRPTVGVSVGSALELYKIKQRSLMALYAPLLIWYLYRNLTNYKSKI